MWTFVKQFRGFIQHWTYLYHMNQQLCFAIYPKDFKNYIYTITSFTHDCLNFITTRCPSVDTVSFFITMSHNWEKQFKMRRDLFWVPVSYDSFCDQLMPYFLCCGKAEHPDRMVWWRTVTLWCQEKEKVTDRKAGYTSFKINPSSPKWPISST
jgi:hypothetical protein